MNNKENTCMLNNQLVSRALDTLTKIHSRRRAIMNERYNPLLTHWGWLKGKPFVIILNKLH